MVKITKKSLLNQLEKLEDKIYNLEMKITNEEQRIDKYKDELREVENDIIRNDENNENDRLEEKQEEIESNIEDSKEIISSNKELIYELNKKIIKIKEEETYNQLLELSKKEIGINAKREKINGVDLVQFNYRLVSKKEFDLNPIGKEARGIIFNEKTKNILCRPFHKFFNLGEHGLKLETLDKSKINKIIEKIDGSLISFCEIGGKIIAKSKSSFTSIHPDLANKIYSENKQLQKLIKEIISKNETPLFELVSPEKDFRIVCKYKKTQLKFLCSRNNQSGEIDWSSTECKFFKFEDLENEIKKPNIEGFVLVIDNELYKYKTEWYLERHSLIDAVNTPKKLDLLILQEKLDDFVYEIIDKDEIENRINHLRKIENHLIKSCEDFHKDNKHLSRGEYALKIIDKDKFLLNPCMNLFSGKEIRKTSLVMSWLKLNEYESKYNKYEEEKRIKNKFTKILKSESKSKLLVLRGVPASGKTTYAKSLIEKGSEFIKRVNLDELRKMIDNSKFSKVKEKEIRSIQKNTINYYLSKNYMVIIDNTHLPEKYGTTDYWNKYLEKENLNIEFKDFFKVPFHICLKRNSKRDELTKVPEKRMYEMKRIIEKPYEYIQNKELSNCVVFDIDGTLAHSDGIRSPYDYGNVDKDKVDEPMKQLVQNLYGSAFTIFLCSGRNESCRTKTEEWLFKHQISYKKLYMRARNDDRKDTKVKEEMLNHIKEKYNVVLWFDDRNSVVEHIRNLGIKVVQVSDHRESGF